MRAQRLGRNARAVLVAPAGDDVIGSAEAGGPVDHRAAADRAPLQDGDGEVGGRPVPAILVEARIGRRFLHVEFGPGVVTALLEHHDARAGGGEAGGDDGASGAAPDDADIGFQDEIALDVRAGDDASRRHLSVPARR